MAVGRGGPIIYSPSMHSWQEKSPRGPCNSLKQPLRSSLMPETTSVVMGARVPKQLHAKIVAKQQRIAKLTGIEPSLNEVVQMLIERGLKAEEKRRP